MRTLLVLVLLIPAMVLAEEKKPPPPLLAHSMTLAIPAGQTTKIVLRGMRLENLKEIVVQHPQGSGKVTGQVKKVGVPNGTKPERVGDSEIEIELTIPQELPGGFLPIAVMGPGGLSNTIPIGIRDETPIVAEKEPNDSLKQAQAITLPVVIEGKIERNQDVDVFAFTGQQGQRVEITLNAARFHSPLDGLLTLYDADGRVLKVDDDSIGVDPKISIVLPATGTYRISLIDTHDLGSSGSLYRMEAR